MTIGRKARVLSSPILAAEKRDGVVCPPPQRTGDPRRFPVSAAAGDFGAAKRSRYRLQPCENGGRPGDLHDTRTARRRCADGSCLFGLARAQHSVLLADQRRWIWERDGRCAYKSRGGRLQIRCENRHVDAGNAPSDIATGDFIVVTVSDTGTGMSEATIVHAFEPFFTTKEPGCGSGLGLSMVQGFAGQSGGGVQIISALGEGTHVALWLPCAQGRSTVHVSLEPAGSAVRSS